MLKPESSPGIDLVRGQSKCLPWTITISVVHTRKQSLGDFKYPCSHFQKAARGGFKLKQSDEKTCVLPHSAVGHRRGQTGCNYVMGFLKSQTKELNLKLLTLGSHHQFLRESVLWDWSGGKTSIVLCNSTNSYVESLFSFLIIPELHES